MLHVGPRGPGSFRCVALSSPRASSLAEANHQHPVGPPAPGKEETGKGGSGTLAHTSSKPIPLAIPSCKGCWEMPSVAGQPRDQLMLTVLKGKRRPAGPGASHTPQAADRGPPAPAEGPSGHAQAPLQCTPWPEERSCRRTHSLLLQKATSPSQPTYKTARRAN